MLVVWSGNWLRYSKLPKASGASTHVGELKEIDVTFHKNTEILRVLRIDVNALNGVPDKSGNMPKTEAIQVLAKVHSVD